MKKLYSLLFITTSLAPGFINSQTILNGYARVVGVGASTITVSSVDETYDSFEDGEQVIIMQMQDNVIGTTANSIDFGDVGSIQSAGLYEVKTIASHTENGMSQPVTITFTDPLSVSFNVGTNTSVQIISFPELGSPNFTTNTDYTAKPWNGATGGIVAFQVQGTLTLANDIYVDGLGFRGAAEDVNTTCGGSVCEYSVYISQWTSRALKGEGIYKNTNPNFEAARGRILNGGGGGSCHNGAGGGGSNYSTGGDGGMGWGCQSGSYEAGGFGGLALGPYINPSRIFMGGGGGAGERNNGYNTSGGNGGGIVLIKATDVVTSGSCPNLKISANGSSSLDIGNDGAGGAGAGGTILFEVVNWNISGSCNIEVEANGGDGGSSLSGGVHGGGGGGGQGAIIYANKAPGSGVSNTVVSGTGGCGNTSNPCNSVAGSGGGVPNGGVLGSGGGSPLPVELIFFSADLVGENVHLSWQTASELNASHYVVERLDDNGDWNEVARLEAAGNSTNAKNYQAIDYYPKVGKNYYRLKQVDNNNVETYYDVKVVHVSAGQLGDVVIYPNPSTGIVNFAFAGHVKVKEALLFDLSGKLISNLMISDQQLTEIDLSALPKGVYMIKVNDEIQKLVLTH